MSAGHDQQQLVVFFILASQIAANLETLLRRTAQSHTGVCSFACPPCKISTFARTLACRDRIDHQPCCGEPLCLSRRSLWQRRITYGGMLLRLSALQNLNLCSHFGLPRQDRPSALPRRTARRVWESMGVYGSILQPTHNTAAFRRQHSHTLPYNLIHSHILS